MQVDHLAPIQVQELIAPIEHEHGQLDILVNDIWGGGEYMVEWNVPVWEHSLENGLRMLNLAIDTHIITSHYVLRYLSATPTGSLLKSRTARKPIMKQTTGCRYSTIWQRTQSSE